MRTVPGARWTYSAIALATAAFTASAELAQVTVTPFFLAAIAGAT